jgi:hypothetical protein
MRKWVGWTASLLVAAGLVAVGSATASAAPARPAACTGTVEITSLAFNPPAVSPGGSSTATLKAQNCTGQTVNASATWTAQFRGAGGGVPAGCPAIDALSRAATFAPHGTVTQSTRYLVPAGCTATSLHLTVRISAGGTVLATGTATLTIN